MVLAWLIFLVIIIIGGIVLMDQFSNFFDELFERINNTAGNDTTGEVFRADDGELVCDLQISIKGEFDEWDFSPLRVRFGEDVGGRDSWFPPVGEYFWKNCHPKSDINPFSLVFFNKNSQIVSEVPALAFGTAIGFGEEISIQLKFTDDEGNTVDATNNPRLFKTIKLPEGGFPIPLAFERTWVLSDIKHQEYDVDIFMGRQINELTVGTPYTYHVLK